MQEITLLKVDNEADLMTFGRYCVDLITDHKDKATSVGMKNDGTANPYQCIGDYQKENHEYFLVKHTGKTIGSVATTLRFAEHQYPEVAVVYIDSFYIEPDSRGLGIGTKVLRLIQERYPERSIELHCLYENRAESLYERLGGVKAQVTYFFPKGITTQREAE